MPANRTQDSLQASEYGIFLQCQLNVLMGNDMLLLMAGTLSAFFLHVTQAFEGIPYEVNTRFSL